MTETKHDRLSSGELFDYKGHTFRFQVRRDEYMGEPWKEHDGHGVISEWTTRAKRPGERVLTQDCNSFRYYDIEATMKIAKRDGWGPNSTADAVERDYKYMRAWCNDEWYWIGVIVVLMKRDEDAVDGMFKTKHGASLWGIESQWRGSEYNSEEYHTQIGYELADQILDESDETNDDTTNERETL